MNRMFLIARREYAAYAMTVGFWLSLLASRCSRCWAAPFRC
jgi:ABC-type Na+ efflux pump permease subunit